MNAPHPLAQYAPELSRAFSSNTDYASKGEVDFYLNEELGWGIELILEGHDLREHRHRFAQDGRYYALKVKDYFVIDFRSGSSSSNLFKHDKKITVFLSAPDFKSCQCVFGNEKEIQTLELST